MKKRTKVILGIAIGVLVLYSAYMTLGMYFASQEINDLRSKYNTALEQSKSSLDKKMDEISESAKFISLEAFAKVIDENAVVSVSSDESAIIRLSMGKKNTEAMVAKMKEFIAFLPDAITKAELKTCIICVVDKTGDVVFGYTFHPDGTSTTFLSDK